MMRPHAAKEVSGGGSFCRKTTQAAGALTRAQKKQGVVTARPLHEIEHEGTDARGHRQGCIGVFQLSV